MRFGEYAVVYDITSDSERTRVDKVLKGFGFRVQKSVYECRLDKRGKRELIEQMEKVGIKTGSLNFHQIVA